MFYNFQLGDSVGEGPSWIDSHPAPTCVPLCLREVRFIKYYGTKCELQVVRYFLKNAKNLEIMRIFSAQTLKAEAKLQMLKNLSASARCSDRCQLLFV